MTADAVDQRPEVVAAVDKLLTVVRSALALFEPYIANVEPDYWEYRLR